MVEKSRVYNDAQLATGLRIAYCPREDGLIAVQVNNTTTLPVHETLFAKEKIDEAHILYMEACEFLASRAKLHEPASLIEKNLGMLFALFRGEKISFAENAKSKLVREPSHEFIPNPGKKRDVQIDGITYQRLPVRTRLITTKDTDILPIIETYVKPYLKTGDIVFVSEKALCITQPNRIVDMNDIKPTPLARFLARNIANHYGSSEFHGFGHGTALAMQLFTEEAGYIRILFAGCVAAITRPFGLRGMFYRICGKRAKSIDCPMSFLILEYAHAAKLPPFDPNGAAQRIAQSLGCDVVILDANYRGAFSLGKSNRAIRESFIGRLFQDNPLGQSDEMTPFCIVRKV